MELLKNFNKKYRSIYWLEKFSTISQAYVKPGTMEFRFVLKENIIAKISKLADQDKNVVVYIEKLQGHCMGETAYCLTFEGKQIKIDALSLEAATSLETLKFLSQNKNNQIVFKEN